MNNYVYYDLSKFNVRFQQLLDSRGMTRADMARETGITPASLSRYMSGVRKPDIDYLIHISKFFNVTIDWLLGFSDERYSKLPKEYQSLVDRYALATDDDRKVIQAVLAKYRGN